MSLAAQQSHHTSFADYLFGERDGEQRHEYLDGEIYAMSGASELHNTVNAELFASLYPHLPDECRAFMSDMKVKIEIATKIYGYYPDIMVACGENEEDPYYRTNPVLLVEVLSPSTRRIDLTEKLAHYTQISSLLEYVIVHPDNPHIMIYRRRNGWRLEHFYAEETFTLDALAVELEVEGIYKKVRKEVGLLQ